MKALRMQLKVRRSSGQSKMVTSQRDWAILFRILIILNCFSGYEAIVELLIENRVDVNIKDDFMEQTAIFIAVQNG